MAKLKTMIVYATTASLAGLMEEGVRDARAQGQSVRLIALEEFRGETESNAGAVYVQRNEGDEELFDRIQAAYPHLEVRDFGGSVEAKAPEQFVEKQADPTLKDLRLQLVALGGSAPAGADAAELADLIAAQKAKDDRVPVLPTPATQQTTIPTSTPVVQEINQRNRAEGGAGEGGDKPLTAKQLEARHSKEELLEMAKDVDGVTADNNKAEIASKIVAARDAHNNG